MIFNYNKHHRRSIRFKEYDYSQAGYYFVTICTHNRECILGVIEDGEMKLNKVGEIIKKVWLSLPNRFHDVKLDEFVIMPNHFHSIIIIGATLMIAQNDRAGTSPAPTIIQKENVGATLVVAQNNNVVAPDNRVGTRPTPTLGDVVGVFKSLCVNSLIN